MSEIEEPRMVVRTTLVVNGVEAFTQLNIPAKLWEFPEYRLALIKNMKDKTILHATEGLEPKVEVGTFGLDVPRFSPFPAGLVTGSEVTIEARR